MQVYVHAEKEIHILLGVLKAKLQSLIRDYNNNKKSVGNLGACIQDISF